MWLDGFRLVDWATRVFGGLPPTLLGGFAFAFLITGVLVAASGFRLTPMSYGLIGAGIGFAVLAYFIAGAAIAAASSVVQGTDTVRSNAPHTVPYAASAVCLGLGAFGVRLALRLWSGEEASGKVMAVMVGITVMGLFYAGVQLARSGAAAEAPAPMVDAEPGAPVPADEEPVRRGVQRAR